MLLTPESKTLIPKRSKIYNLKRSLIGQLKLNLRVIPLVIFKQMSPRLREAWEKTPNFMIRKNFSIFIQQTSNSQWIILSLLTIESSERYSQVQHLSKSCRNFEIPADRASDIKADGI